MRDSAIDLLADKVTFSTCSSRRKRWADHFDRLGVKYAFFSALNATALQEAAALAEQAAAIAELSDEEVHSEEEESEEEGEVPQPRKYKPQKEVKKEVIDLEKDEQREEEGYEERTRVLSVLELEELFDSAAPDLNGQSRPPRCSIVEGNF